MRILIVASEAAPFIKTGDVANVIIGLAKELCRQNHDVRVAIPFYRNLNLGRNTELQPVIEGLSIPLGTYGQRTAKIWQTRYKFDTNYQLPFYLVENTYYFGRDKSYGYLDDYERFIFFTRTTLEMLHHPNFTSELWQPEVIHGHDWVAGLIPMWLRHIYLDKFQYSPAFLYTLHNANLQGVFNHRAIKLAELTELGVFNELGETSNRINFMLRGLLAADIINTVSPTHAEEIMGGRYAETLQKTINVCHLRIDGVLNGLDDSEYDPSFDDHIKAKFGPRQLSYRVKNKKALQKTLGFTVSQETPLVGIVGRLITDKGAGLLETALPQLMHDTGVQLIVMGTIGDYRYREAFTKFEQLYPGRIKTIFSRDATIYRQVFAGIDIILVPSLHEPCGLQQMMGMHYGAFPIVRRTGGLADTVSPWDTETDKGKGVLFEAFEAEALIKSIKKGIEFYQNDSIGWNRVQEYNMVIDFSWRKSANEYLQLYQKAIENSKNRPKLLRGQSALPSRNDLLINTILEVNDLAMTTDLSDYLKHIARSTRELVQGDAVLIWIKDETKPQFLRIGSYSLRPSAGPSEFDFSSQRTHFEQGSLFWQSEIYRIEEGAVSKTRLGFLGSELALEFDWQVQMSAPINTHGSVLGQLDVFSDKLERYFEEWEIDAISALANTIAINLEKIRLINQSNNLLAVDREMAQAQSVGEFATSLLHHTKKLTNADLARLSLVNGSSYSIDEQKNLLGPLGEESPLFTGRHPISANLVDDTDKKIGQLEIVKREARTFSRDDETVLGYLAQQAANTLQTVYLKERRDLIRVQQLSVLAASLVGGLGFDQLLELVVGTTANVLNAQAASLYLVDEEDPDKLLIIRAAAGYHRPLLKKGASYRFGEGTTGWIAKTGKTFKADSLEELHKKSPWAGKHMSLQGGREPNAFLGIPLKIMDHSSGEEQVIGVLKLEDRDEILLPDQSVFSDEEMHLGEMMASIIATVVYNTHLSEKRLQTLSLNLDRLSGALIGGQDSQTLFDNIVNTITEVLRVAAASLYLVDEGDPDKLLIIRAAAGYHRPLLKKGASYRFGEGTTGWIAKTGKTFKADSLEELHKKSPWAGKHMSLQGGREPNAFLGIPLKIMDHSSGEEQVIGVLKLEDRDEILLPDQSVFSDEEMRLGEMMANIIATVVYNTQLSEKRLKEFSNNLEKLSGALVVSQDRRMLMNSIVKTIKNVLEVDASSLYLVNEKVDRLVIEAASGYQEPLVEAGASYAWGEGVTGRIAETNQPFRANSIDELRQQGRSEEGKYDDLHKFDDSIEHDPSIEMQLRPNSFYGLPLRVQGRKKPIGVLKAENISKRPFTDEDVLLIEMMGNVIATVVYNTQVSEARLREFSDNLSKLSSALAGSRDRQSLMSTIVNTIKSVLVVDAVSLYLSDDKNQTLSIQAASGYQEPLVKAGAFYRWGEGVTGRIAETNEPFGANSTDVLRQQGGSQRGKYDHLQNDIRPKTFFGIPLRVQGRDKPMGVLKAESINERPFTDEDKLLIEMMGNVISTIVYNAQLNQSKLENIVKTLGTPQFPRPESAEELLSQFARTEDRDTLELMAISLANSIGSDTSRAYSEAIKLLDMKANPELFNHIAGKSPVQYIQRRYSLFYQVLRIGETNREKLENIFKISHLWVGLEEANSNENPFHSAVSVFIQTMANACHAHSDGSITQENWVGILVDTSQTFENSALPTKLPFFFHRQGSPQDKADLETLHRLLVEQYEDLNNIVMPMWGDKQLIERANRLLQNKIEQPFAIDVVTMDLSDIQKVIGASRPDIELQRVVLAQINLITISPYQIVGPVNQRFFFGREKELRQINDTIKSASFAITAGRRVGKTSILRQLQYVRLSTDEFHIDYYDCGPETMYDKLLDLLNSSSSDKKIVLLLDEADGLTVIDRKNDWALFKTMRSRINSGFFQVVLSGERTLREALRDSDSPLFNLVNKIVLGPLDYRSVEELVTKPIKQMEINLVDEESIVKNIYNFTSGHPNIVQRICSRLIELLNNEKRRIIFLDDVTTIIEDPGFQRDDFLDTYWERAKPLEKIISLLMVDINNICTFAEIYEAIQQHCRINPEIIEVDKALQSLVDIRSILKRNSSGYEFAVTAFPDVVGNTITSTETLYVQTEEYLREKNNEDVTI